MTNSFSTRRSSELVSTSALGSVRTLDAGDAAKAGIAGGLSKSSDKLTDFYLDLARQAGPIVEVGAAKDVVVVIQEGVTLEIKPTAGSKFRSEEHTSELQSLMRISYAVFCLKKKKESVETPSHREARSLPIKQQYSGI